MQITIADKSYDINNIEDDKIKLQANIFIAKVNHHRLNAEGSQILVNTFENSLSKLLEEREEALIKPVDKSS